MQIFVGGYCYSCCPSWTKIGHIGKISAKTSITDIWNSKRIRHIRKCILDDNLEEVCDLKYCPIAVKNQNLELNNIHTNSEHMKNIIRQIRMGKTHLHTAPYTFELANSGACNLNCIMCRSNNKYIRKDNHMDKYIFSELLPDVLPDISELILSGFGDPLFNKYTRRFLQTLETERYPQLRINLITNGLLFTERLWQTIKHNNYGWINISIDASCKSTYEYIRKDGKWNILQKNLSLIHTLKKRRYFSSFKISFIVMKSNYKEIKDFAELGLKYECDSVVFQRMFGNVNVKENINFTRNKKIMIEIARLLAEPVFMRKQIDTTLIDDYRSCISGKSNNINSLYTIVAESLLHSSMVFVHYICKRFPFLYIFVYRIYQFLKTIKIFSKMHKIKYTDKA